MNEGRGLRPRRTARAHGVVLALVAVVGAAVASWPGMASAASRAVSASASRAVGPSGASAVPTGFPASPPAAICDNPAMLTGPATAPRGAVVVKAGKNTGVNWNKPGVTFWFAPGVHTFGTTAAAIVPVSNTSFVGAPGAILDGKGVNTYAFGKFATGVSISYLTIQGFVPTRNTGAVNHETSTGWTVQHNTIQNNQGAGVMVAPSNVVSFNCLRNNGQYGYSAFGKGGNTNITIDHNEISGNNTANWEATLPGCGCSGAGKIWNTIGGTITNNWIHDNVGSGIWVDTNNAGLLIDGNYIDDNDAEGIIYEVSYNGRITNNNLLHNGFVEGRSFAATGSTFPVGAIYIAESGGDSRVAGGLYSTFDISGNSLDGNWGGITVWENPNRFCGSDPQSTFCTLVNPQANLTTCVPGTINNAPYFSDCRWKTQNVAVHDNQVIFSRTDAGCTTTGCGEQALLAGTGSEPSWSPYLGTSVDTAITTTQNNHFADNSYVGDVQFVDFTTNPLSLGAFQAAPFAQDGGSALTPLARGNLLDADTASAEGSAGRWVPWFSATAASSTAQAHGGGHSLQVKLTAPFGWGVQLVNWPGFHAAPGPQTLSFWALQGTSGSGGGGGGGGVQGATITADWRNPSGGVLGHDTVSIATLGPQWQQASGRVVAPAGTAFVTVELTGTTGAAGDSVFVDQVFVGTPATSANQLDAD
ncbi:MAG: hypothetical protein QOK20_2078, partial [Acidimicrobiaceae bacterium]|nr:hypothetical protein [Acidimicrobiaceae bacterium]